MFSVIDLGHGVDDQVIPTIAPPVRGFGIFSGAPLPVACATSPIQSDVQKSPSPEGLKCGSESAGIIA